MNMLAGRTASHEVARNLWPHQIAECDCPDTLLAWYAACTDFADDLVAQIETNNVVQIRDAGWKHKVSMLLIGANKSKRQIERRAAQIGLELPPGRNSKWRARIAELEEQAATARQYERELVVDYLNAMHGARGAEIAEELTAKEHHRWRREQRDGGAA
jgi:hypothetical protein